MTKEDKQTIIEDFLQYCLLNHNTNLMHYDDEASYEYRQPTYEYADEVSLIKEYLSEKV